MKHFYKSEENAFSFGVTKDNFKAVLNGVQRPCVSSMHLKYFGIDMWIKKKWKFSH